MKRYLNPALAAAGLCAALAFAGCDSGASSSGTTAATDTQNSTDSTVTDTTKADTSAPDTTTGGGGDADASADTTKADATTADTTPSAVCDPACASGKYCDLMAKPPVCKDMTCKLPDKFGATTQKASKLELPGAGSGCDLNGDGKPDNALGSGLSMLLGQANDALKKTMAEGKLVILMNTDNFKADGGAFSLDMLIGDPDASNATCDFTSDSANCKYTVSPSSFDMTSSAANCPALINFPNAKVTGGKLSGGGANQKFVLNLPVAGVALSLSISQAQIQGDVTGAWDKTTAGQICGVLTKADLEKAINSVPDEQLAGLGMDKATVLQLFNSMVTPDFSTTGGANDAYSVAIAWESVKGQITGMTPAK